MGALSYIKLGLTHPNELRTLIQFYLTHEPKRDITNVKEYPTSGYDRESMRRCWEFLDKTSRSFAAVIKELDGDLARTVCIYYLVLRGLDTVEDDMTIPNEVKLPLLRNFYKKISEPGWTFDGNGPNEKDRELLVQYDVVVTEMGHLDTVSRQVITDACRKMGAGMADFAAQSPSSYPIRTKEDYDLYCHYVAGIVGEGLSGLFVSTDKEPEFIGNQLVLSNSMGLLLQKTNILRDFREDVDEERHFWPKAYWAKFGFSTMKEMHAWCERGPRVIDPKTRETDKDRAIWSLNLMCLDALRHTTDALDYLTLLRNQSVFNFCAIPAVMALATIALCFNNEDVFRRNVKIRKSQAVGLIMNSTNPRDVAYMCRDFTRQLHSKLRPADPSFVAISIACGKIEQWCEHRYPSFVILKNASGGTSSYADANTTDARLRIVERQQELVKRHGAELRQRIIQEKGSIAAAAEDLKAQGLPITTEVAQAQGLPKEFFMVMAGMFVLVVGLGAAITYVIIVYFAE
jgi:farnesyl-diphosphate farnesyltransferase